MRSEICFTVGKFKVGNRTGGGYYTTDVLYAPVAPDGAGWRLITTDVESLGTTITFRWGWVRDVEVQDA